MFGRFVKAERSGKPWKRHISYYSWSNSWQQNHQATWYVNFCCINFCHDHESRDPQKFWFTLDRSWISDFCGLSPVWNWIFQICWVLRPGFSPGSLVTIVDEDRWWQDFFYISGNSIIWKTHETKLEYSWKWIWNRHWCFWTSFRPVFKFGARFWLVETVKQWRFLISSYFKTNER